MGQPASKREKPAAMGGLESSSRRAVAQVNDGRLLRAIAEFEAQARQTTDVGKVAKLALRAAVGLFAPDAACLALLEPRAKRVGVVQQHALAAGVAAAPGAEWAPDVLLRFVRQHRVDTDNRLALGRLRRRGRGWGVIALRWGGSEPSWGVRDALRRLCESASRVIEDLERSRLIEVRTRIDRKIMEQLRPKDLFYQIIDGLRSLTGYDHSAMLLLWHGGGALEIAAEQLAWRKGRSRRVGARVAMAAEVAGTLDRGRAWCYSVRSGLFEPHDPASPASLGPWLSVPLPERAEGEPCEAEVIFAPLHIENELAAVLRLSTQHPGTFGLYECGLVEQLIPQATVALHNARRTESLEDKVIQAERKHAMADLARGVSHDVNNALGAILPLVQQMRAEADEGRLRTSTIGADLEQIEKSVQVCRRIFGGMLNLARRTHAGERASSSLHQAIEGAMSILGDSLARHRIEVVRDIEHPLPELPVSQAELEQVLLNLIGNARDAMHGFSKGVLRIHARRELAPDARAMVRFEIADTGSGIPSEHMDTLFEPFFTTKPSGSGLGLAVCRSIISGARGEIRVESPDTRGAMPIDDLGPGARMIVRLPVAGAP